MFKKILSLVLVLAMTLSLGLALTACNDTGDEFKIGFICLHDENSTYDLNFLNAVDAAQAALGLEDSQVIVKKNIPESDACYQAAADLVDQGCDIVFANSFGHEDFMLKAAKEFPDVQFCHATGYKAALNPEVTNYQNAFADIYEGRYLAGVAAGLKLNEMIEAGEFTAEEAKIGYVGAFTYAEVISGYTSFYLGAKSVCPTVTMDVQFTGSWFDPTEENNAAKALIARNCKLISQHADSMGAPSACEEAGVPNVSYNGSTVASCPNTFIIASAINWAPYYEFIVNCVKEGKDIPADWCGGIAEGSVVLTDINTNAAAAGTAEKLAAVKAALVAGTTKVFDTTTFTVVEADQEKFNADTNLKDGYYDESSVASAPAFAYNIVGIYRVNEKF